MAGALVRVLDELLWSLRREGFVVSTAQAIDAGRAVEAVGIEDRGHVREALAAVVVQRARDRPRFDALFHEFFSIGTTTSPPRRTLWERLAAAGFTDAELSALRDLMQQLAAGGVDGAVALGALLDRGADLDRLLALSGVSRTLDAHGEMLLGFQTHRLLGQLGTGGARQALALLRSLLVDALGPRATALAEALARELEQTEDAVRAFVRRTYETRVAELERERGERRLETTPFTALSDVEIEEVRRAVRRFAERLRGGARVRARHARHGRIDPHRTLRRALRTAGVPFAPARRQRRRDRPRLVVLCDVSDSVRAAACFLLEFAYAAQELFSRARTFVFVSELGETTQLFEREPVRAAIARAWGGGVVPAADNSNYGRVLRAFDSGYLRDLDRRTTVVILGDGRTNFHDAAPEVLDRVRERCRALLWLCPEPRSQWGQGDSAMSRYAPKCTAVYEVRTAADLETAARALVAR
jgi:uncharacterized protein with von Willebrand factor type A (vWA) domain